MQNYISHFFTYYFVYELPGWGFLYKHIIGDENRNERWKNAGPRVFKNKQNGLYYVANLQEWSDRLAFFLRRWWDLSATQLIDRFVKQGDCVIDIGANYGHFTLAASKKAGADGRIIAFEPSPVNFARLAVNCDLNHLQNVTMHSVALSDTPGNMVLSVPRANSGEATLANSKYASDEVDVYNVDVCVGDVLLADVQPDYIKIDVEGFEPYVVRGLESLLRKHLPILMTEVVTDHLARAGETPQTLNDFLSSIGYEAFSTTLQRRGWKQHTALVSWSAQTHTDDVDVIWIPKDRVAEFRDIIEQ